MTFMRWLVRLPSGKYVGSRLPVVDVKNAKLFVREGDAKKRASECFGKAEVIEATISVPEEPRPRIRTLRQLLDDDDTIPTRR